MVNRKLSESVKKKLAHKQNYLCNICNVCLPPSYQADHIIPHKISNDDSEENIQILCPNCHSVKTQREYSRILQVKSLMLKCPSNTSLCWYCLEKTNDNEEHTCSKIVKEISNIVKERKSVSSFEKMLKRHIYLDKDLSTIFDDMKLSNSSNVLSIEICLDNRYVCINNRFMYKLSTEDELYPSDIADVVSFAIQKEKCSQTFDTIEINLLKKEKYETFEDDKDECYKYITEVLIDYLPEQILSKNVVYFILT